MTSADFCNDLNSLRTFFIANNHTFCSLVCRKQAFNPNEQNLFSSAISLVMLQNKQKYNHDYFFMNLMMKTGSG